MCGPATKHVEAEKWTTQENASLEVIAVMITNPATVPLPDQVK
jgi:hypothetical protein